LIIGLSLSAACIYYIDDGKHRIHFLGRWLICPGLFDPIQIKRLTLKNRLVMAPMATGLPPKTAAPPTSILPTIPARAKGGVGLIIIEHTFVAKEGKASRGQLGTG